MKIKIVLIVLLLFTGLVGTVHALIVVEVTKLTASDGFDSVDNFGVSVDISGDTAVVGAFGDNDLGDFAGAAFIFQRTRTGWTEVDKLHASDGATFDFFGESVAIDGNTAIIGASENEDLGQDFGSAYIFQRTQTGWVEVTKLSASDGEDGDQFGVSVDISGDTVVVGASRGDGQINDTGAAYIFQRTQSGWTEVDKLTASDGEAFDSFGRSVAISDNIVIAGASGAAYIFQSRGSSWTESARLTASDEGITFGRSVAISGNNAVVEGGGAAYTFQSNGSSWQEQAKLTASDGAFASSVDINRNTIVIGSIFGDGVVNNSGTAYIFQLTGTGWTEQAKLSASDGDSFDFFGTSVAIDEHTALVGAQSDDNLIGSAYIFKLR